MERTSTQDRWDRIPYEHWGVECRTEKTDSLTGAEVMQAVECCRQMHGEAPAYLVLCRPGLSQGLQLPLLGGELVVREKQHVRPGTIQVFPG